MQTILLIDSEVTDLKVRWCENEPKSADLIAAAKAAGFSDREIEFSPLGRVEEDFAISPTEVVKAGAAALIGANGAMVLELTITGPVGVVKSLG